MTGKTFCAAALIMMACPGIEARTYPHTVWQIGTKDGSSSEFALTGRHYSEITGVFPECVAIYSVGKNDAGDIPYVIPGPADSWAGNPQGALMIRFGAGPVHGEASLKLEVKRKIRAGFARAYFAHSLASRRPFFRISRSRFCCWRGSPGSRRSARRSPGRACRPARRYRPRRA